MRRALRDNSVKRGDTASDSWLIFADPSLSHILFYFCFLRFFLPSLLAPSPEKAQLLCITAASCCGPGGGGSSQAGTEVSFLVFHPDQTTSTLPTHYHKPPKPTLLLPLAPLSASPLHIGCPHLSRRQLSIISVSQNPAGAHCARGRRRRQALGGSGGPQMESALSIIVTNY